MNRCLLLVAVVALAGCGDAGEAERLHRLDSLAVTRQTAEPGAVAAMLAPALSDGRGGLHCGRVATAWDSGETATYIDRARATLCARLGCARWASGDTAGALEAYEGAVAWSWLLDSGYRAEALRSTAVVAEAAGDPSRAVALLTDAERAALASGQNALAAHIIRCRLRVVEGCRTRITLRPPPPAGTPPGLVFVLGGVFVLVLHLTLRAGAARGGRGRGGRAARARRARGRSARWPTGGLGRPGRTR